MRYWFSVHLPLLPLESVRPRWCEPAPYVVIEKGKVISVSREAFALGVRVGMRPGGVSAIAPSTLVLERDLQREEITRNAVALALLQFTPEVAHADDFSILLDVTASLRLFRGYASIGRRIRASTQAIGVTVRIGTGPTAMGAWLLARLPLSKRQSLLRRTIKMASMERQLDHIPCDYLPAAVPHLEWLAGIGATNLAALRRLPRQGIQRRMSKQVLEELDRAFGLMPEMHRWIAIPETFAARIETFDRVENAEALLDGATGLLEQFVGWLVARQQAVSTFAFMLEHERGREAIPATEVEIRLGEPAWRVDHMSRLLKERFPRVELVAPVIAVRLEVRLLAAMVPLTEDLFPEPGGSPADFKRLMELLGARLGPENVCVPVNAPDHVPEAANAWIPMSHAPAKLAGTEAAFERPFWLLDEPHKLLVRDDRPFYGSPLKMIKGPERIEGHWWNGQTAARDYYIAQAADASCYWIYLERVPGGSWYLHGKF
ncbi:DNA polymerase Y family protein [Duganella sp. CY15W]|nr:DNA polymerase Y family protein [Duganella sp. CY15W]